MTSKPPVTYFPVLPAEQAVLERLRQPDLRTSITDVPRMLDLIAEAGVSVGELENALALLQAAEDEQGLDARFEALEARLRQSLERRLAEMEGRLSQRLGGAPPPAPSAEEAPPLPRRPGAAPSPRPTEATLETEVSPKAAVAIRVGDELLQGDTAVSFYTAFWSWMFDEGHISHQALPIASGKQRYVIAREPVHPTGKPFTGITEVCGAYVEKNLSRSGIVRITCKLLDQTGLEYEVLVGGDAPPPAVTGDRQEELAEFWRVVLAESHARSDLHRGLSGENEKWSWVGTRRGAYAWNFSVRQHDAQAELYIDTSDAAENERLFDALVARRGSIERAFGGELDWQRLPGKRACRIRYVVDIGGYRDHDAWNDIAEQLVDAMIRLEAALRPWLEE